MTRNRLARMRLRAAPIPPCRGIVDLRVDVRVIEDEAKRSIRVERVRDGFEVDRFAMDSRKVKRVTPRRAS